MTIPAEVRRLLGVRPRDTVVFEIDGTGGVHLVVARYTLESAHGAVAPRRQPEDFEQRCQAAKEEHAHQVVHQLAQE